jgi:hypothetical protein
MPGANVVPVHIVRRGDGLGAVTWQHSGQPAQVCTGDCTLSVPSGTELLLSATPGLNSVVRGWSVASCGTDATCSLRVDVEASVEVRLELAFNVAFVTSEVYAASALPRPGDAANQECSRLAAAAGLHGSRFVAWLAAQGPTLDAADDVTPIRFLQRRGGWVRVDGAPVARSLAHLTRGELLHPINRDEYGGVAPSIYSWGAVTSAGLLYQFAISEEVVNCSDWTSTDPAERGGLVYNNSISLDGGSVVSCTARNTLLCLGDDSDAEVPVLPKGGRLAFVSTGSFTASGGLGGADALCQREACDVGLTGSTSCATDLGVARTFKAYLHTSTQPAWERFDLTGPTWVRLDGVQWLPSAAALAADGLQQLTVLNVRADSTFGRYFVWVGDVAAVANCRDWTSESDADLGMYATALALPNASFGTGIDQSCAPSASTNHLFCLEE